MKFLLTTTFLFISLFSCFGQAEYGISEYHLLISDNLVNGNWVRDSTIEFTLSTIYFYWTEYEYDNQLKLKTKLSFYSDASNGTVNQRDQLHYTYNTNGLLDTIKNLYPNPQSPRTQTFDYYNDTIKHQGLSVNQTTYQVYQNGKRIQLYYKLSTRINPPIRYDYVYDNQNRLSNFETCFSNDSLLCYNKHYATVSYDSITNNMTNVSFSQNTDSVLTTIFKYDYLYDSITSKLTRTTLSFLNDNVWEPSAVDSFAYDIHGNLIYESYFGINSGLRKYRHSYKMITNNTSIIEKPKISIYPNPARDQIQLEVPFDFVGSHVLLYSIDGKLIRQFESRQKNETIDISKLNSGLYFFKISNKKNTVTLKLVKQ